MSASVRSMLIALLGAPAAWTVHLLAGYVILALWCSAGWPGVRTALVVLTLACFAAAALSGLATLRLRREGGARTSDERAHFVTLVGLAMAPMFAWLILLQGLPPLLAPACPATITP